METKKKKRRNRKRNPGVQEQLLKNLKSQLNVLLNNLVSITFAEAIKDPQAVIWEQSPSHE